MAYFEPASFNSLFRRCVTCDDTAQTSCPSSCPTGQVCGQIPPTCDTCQHMTCVPDPNAAASVSPTKSSSTGPNAGAIAGGVIGGVIAIAVATYLVWRFCIKPRRQQFEQEEWAEEHEEQTDAEKEFTMRRDARASTHTVGSIASTVLSRASNIIQIAYIPGVTNRSDPSTPGLLVPPVPPIPIALSSAASTPRFEQEHFFMPGELRDSTYSGISDRTSYARTSVASTIYGKNAIVSPIPAQTVIRGKAAVVSVRSNGANSPGDMTPPVPSVDYSKYQSSMGRPPSAAFSVGSTFLNSASAATQVKPQVISMKKSRSTLGDDQSDTLLPPDSPANGMFGSPIHGTTSPFRDPPIQRSPSHGSLGAVTKISNGSMRDSTPFGDEHEMKH
ncbi:hypothetical protein GLAREA_10570 [Glarea lozoyensis ATCC 20868]|uniref:Membrane anchor Opy2 N-terminal domain-containing protein n=1 Tax=Glarea lozoyensis (strain ATCC 20868 / MF5171) TaxID=1116229 RepID=S3DAY1_GLAL2|nr:uncharacterized protein GLAREA_10570 [Glarea lozoyensis ATCC 20868]EPE34875.1 hypothetical protein GLAREA_10570 [Glarea lozoyensis ATCC 20868]